MFDPAPWLAYAFRWSRRQRPRHWDWEQAALDGLHRAWESYEPARGGVRTHVDRCLGSAAVDLAKHHDAAFRRAVASVPAAALARVACPDPPGDDAADAINPALRRLDARARLTLLLHCYDGVPIDAIGRANGLGRMAERQYLARRLAAAGRSEEGGESWR